MSSHSADVLPLGTKALVVAFTTSGVVHMVRPQVFYPLIPPQLGSVKGWTYASGVAELVCAAGLASRQPWAPQATAAVLAGVWVGNWWLAIRVTRSGKTSPWLKAGMWARVPLQIPMIKAALRSPVRG
jgi:uncharacterized membrane protein